MEPGTSKEYLQRLDEWARALEEVGEAVAQRRDWYLISELLQVEVDAWYRLRRHFASALPSRSTRPE